MSMLDIAALAVFIVGWLLHQPVLRHISHRGTTITNDMTVVRRRWMSNMTSRDNRLMDSQLMGHLLSSASFFASANMIIIAAAAGALFRADATHSTVAHLAPVDTGPRWLFAAKLALVVLTLARGLLDFVWSIRQMNYTLAAIGAAPDPSEPPTLLKAYGEAVASVLNPAISSFNNGVRAYYFALAAAAWMIGPWAMIAGTIGAVALLYARQVGSRAAVGVQTIRTLLDGLDRARSGEDDTLP
jgi:uncharacterized membrane protein